MQVDGCAAIKKLARNLQPDTAAGTGDDDIQTFEQRWMKHGETLPRPTGCRMMTGIATRRAPFLDKRFIFERSPRL
jgi:hypothetical protein